MQAILHKKIFFLVLLFLPLSLFAHPFKYDLQLEKIPGTCDETLIFFHGMGGNYRISQVAKNFLPFEEQLVSFNFPDHDIRLSKFEAEKTSFGSINEILPAIYVLKEIIVNEGSKHVNLYGFSAGGGVIINTLAVLNTSYYDGVLRKIGVGPQDKKAILDVLQDGLILLDSPLKSLREILAQRGVTSEMEILAKRYRENDKEPIDTIRLLKGLKLNFIVYFEVPDTIVSNRDDALFIERLKEYNPEGSVTLITDSSGGHTAFHPKVWEAYQKNKTRNCLPFKELDV